MPEVNAAPAPIDLDAAIRPIAASLLPGWTVTSAWVDASSMPLDGALAVCTPTPTRCLAHFDVLTPWPPEESLSETLWHEAGHAWISPLTSLIPASDGAVMLEEQIVERLGVLLGKLSPLARRAVLRGVDKYCGAPMRARISALAARARSGGPMDPKMVTEALEALIGGDSEKCAEILKGMIAQAAGGAAPAADPDADDMAGKVPEAAAGEPPMEDPKGKPPAAGASPAPPNAAEAPRLAARLAALDLEHSRARKAANATTSIAVRARLRELRVDGVALPTNLEADLGKMTDLDAFEQRVADITAGRALSAPGGSRARAQIPGGFGATPPPVDFGAAPTVTPEQLRAEHADEGFVTLYETLSKSDPSGAAGLLAGFREPSAVAMRARLASRGPAGRAHGRSS